MSAETEVVLGLSLGLLVTPFSGLAGRVLLKRYTRRVALLTGSVPGWRQVRPTRRHDEVDRHTTGGFHEVASPSTPNLLEAHARRFARGNACVHLVASIAFIVTATVLMWWEQQDVGSFAKLVLIYALLLGFPMILTARLLWAPSRLLRVSLISFCIIDLFAIVTTVWIWSESSSDVAIPVALILISPFLMLLISSAARPLRGVSWFVAPIFTALGVGVSLVILPFSKESEVGVVVLVSASVMAICIAFAVAVWLFYRARLFGDQGVAICLLWFYQSYFLCFLGLLTEARWHAYLGLGPFLVFSLVLAAGYFILRHRTSGLPAHHLLLLRSFSPGLRNVWLLRDVDLYWRHLGGVVLIGGVDLAAETLEPDEFLEWCRGRVGHRVITSIRDIAGHLSQLDLQPDADGRYRVYDLVCTAETWQETFAALARRVCVVLIDLRGFTDAHSGLAWEVEHLGNVGARAVVLTDETSDEQLVATLLAKWTSRADQASWSVLHVGGHRVSHARRVLRALSVAVASEPRAGKADQVLPPEPSVGAQSQL